MTLCFSLIYALKCPESWAEMRTGGVSLNKSPFTSSDSSWKPMSSSLLGSGGS